MPGGARRSPARLSDQQQIRWQGGIEVRQYLVEFFTDQQLGGAFGGGLTSYLRVFAALPRGAGLWGLPPASTMGVVRGLSKIYPGAALVLVAGGLGWLAVHVWGLGLDRADQLASALGLFVGLLSLLLTGVGLRLAWAASREAQAARTLPKGSSGQSVTGSVVAGPVHQVRNVKGGLAIDAFPGGPPVHGAGKTSAGHAAAADIVESGQAIANTQVYGAVVQVDGVDGDVEIIRRPRRGGPHG